MPLRNRDFKGSRFYCLTLASLPRPQVARFLSTLAQPAAIVSENDTWVPNRFSHPKEPCLDKNPHFLPPTQREALASWWPAVRNRATTPTWDIVSTCSIAGRKGLLLVEAKAHDKELPARDKCRAKNIKNKGRIRAALGEANRTLTAIRSGWALSPDTHFRLSNRFALAWKLASHGVPVVLVYLGFLNANLAHLVRPGRPFKDHQGYAQRLVDYARSVVPHEAWSPADSDLGLSAASITALIRVADAATFAVRPTATNAPAHCPPSPS